MSKASIPQGTRDFSGVVVRRRNYILQTIRSIFEKYGYSPLETPAMENLETLMGKYGEEGDKLIFKILNNGLNDPKNLDKAKAGFDNLLAGKNTSQLTERALRYDLTIPFARFVAMNHGEITFPYKRYQIQPVWRADRPQKGRYREFTQCDADVVGSKSLLNEVELSFIYHEAFTTLGLTNYSLQINSRKLLTALAEDSGQTDSLTNITTAIDKLDKIGIGNVLTELKDRGLNAPAIEKIKNYLQLSGSNKEVLEGLRNMFPGNEMAAAGIQDLEYILENTAGTNILLTPTLARGLNYYTGTIFEVKAPEGVKMGSIGGGGRYDDLTGLFGVNGIAGVGISFGVDRIYDVLETLELFPENLETASTVLFFNLGEKEAAASFKILQELRAQNLSGELFHENLKMDKQFKYAEKKQIPYIVIIGDRELGSGQATVKELKTGRQVVIPISTFIGEFKKLAGI